MQKVQIIDLNRLTWNREEPRIKSSRFLNGATVRVSILVFLMTKMSKLLCLTTASSINNHGIFLLLSATVEMKQISVYHNFAKYSFYLMLKMSCSPGENWRQQVFGRLSQVPWLNKNMKLMSV